MQEVDPLTDTTTKGMNEPISLEEWTAAQLEDVMPVERARVSKHRGGRQPKMRASEKRRRIREQRERIRNAVDTAALLKAMR